MPTGVTSINVDAMGAQGYTGYGGQPGLGGRVQATLTVTPGENLYIYVGQAGLSCNTGGYNGGAASSCAYSYSGNGGGASDIRRGGTALSNRIIVAGGGGGAGYNWGSSPNDDGGHGGGLTGGRNESCAEPGAPGYGGTQSGGGAGGLYSGWPNGNIGSLGTGGAGATTTGGGGGGGGYYGGGGGSWSGGGGGSSYVTPSGSSSIAHTYGHKTGNGQVVISWTAGGSGSASCPSPRTAVVATVNPPSPAPTTTGATICSGSTATISASGSTGNYSWWTASSGGSNVGSGANFVTPVLYSNTTYYAQAEAGATSFYVNSLLTSGALVTDHNTHSGDDRAV